MPQTKRHPGAGTLNSCTGVLRIDRPCATMCTYENVALAVFYFWCERWDLNPHDLTDTSTSSLPVCRFQHARERNLRYYNKIPPFVKRQPEKLPESFAVRPVAQAYKNSFFRGKEKKPSKPCGFKGFPVVIVHRFCCLWISSFCLAFLLTYPLNLVSRVSFFS